MELDQQQTRLQELIIHGKKQGGVTWSEVTDYMEDTLSSTDPDTLQAEEAILSTLEEMGIPVYDMPSDLENLLSSDKSNELPVEETAAIDTNINLLGEDGSSKKSDLVRMYMKAMGAVKLLTRQGEIVLAIRIEEGLQEILLAIAKYPFAIKMILVEYQRYEKKEIRLNDIISGFLDLEEKQSDIKKEKPPKYEEVIAENIIEEKPPKYEEVIAENIIEEKLPKYEEVIVESII